MAPDRPRSDPDPDYDDDDLEDNPTRKRPPSSDPTSSGNGGQQSPGSSFFTSAQNVTIHGGTFVGAGTMQAGPAWPYGVDPTRLAWPGMENLQGVSPALVGAIAAILESRLTLGNLSQPSAHEDAPSSSPRSSTADRSHPVIPDISGSQWIWTQEEPYDEPPAGGRAFRKVVNLPHGTYADAMVIDITCDDLYTLYVNGSVVGNGTAWTRIQRYSVSFARATRVVIAVYASNHPEGMGQAGLIAAVTLWDSVNHDRRPLSLGTDATWRWSASAATNGFHELRYRADGSWEGVRVNGYYGRPPWWDVPKPIGFSEVTGGFSGVEGVEDPPDAPLATPGLATNRTVASNGTSARPTSSASTPIPQPDIGDSDWIWTHEQPYDEPPCGPRAFRKFTTLPSGFFVDSMIIDITCDDIYTLYVNDHVVGHCSGGWENIQRYSIRFPRTNRVLIAVCGGNDPLTRGQAGLLVAAVMWDSVEYEDWGGRTFKVGTDGSWVYSETATTSGFHELSYRPDNSWDSVRLEGRYGAWPWGEIEKPEVISVVSAGDADSPSAPLALPGFVESLV